MTVDYTQAQDRSKILRAMMGQNFQPVQGANMGTALGKILTSYFLSKGMDKQGNLMQEAVKNEDNRKRMDLGRMMSAYREDTPYQPGPDELMPGEQPIPGLKMEGQGRNRDALLMAMASNPDYAGAALPAMFAQPKIEKGTSLQQNLAAAGYIQGTPEYEAKILELMGKPGTEIKMPPLASAPPPGYRNVFEGNKLIRQEIIPGGVAEKEAEAEEAAAAQESLEAEQSTQQGKVKNTEFLKQIDDAIDNNTFWTTGMIGKILSFKPGSDAAFQEKLLERIQGQVALERLQQAQAASKTGGVFGSLQEKELNLLMNSLEALYVGMTGEQMTRGLEGIREHTLKWEGYQQLWDDTAAMERGFYGFGRYLPDKKGVEILDQDNFVKYENEVRTGIKQDYSRMGVYQ